MTANNTPEYYIGLMSGTSLDGLDIALCEIDNHGVTQLVASQQTPLPETLRQDLLELTQPRPDELDTFARCDRLFAQFCGQAVASFLAAHKRPSASIRAIGSHGQTVRHMPSSKPAYTVQLGCPATIAVTAGIDVVAQFRQKDIALGGQGAPLAPAFHSALVRSYSKAEHKHSMAVINIGGIANITLLQSNAATIGYDTGPGNCLLDGWYSLHHPTRQQQFDLDGAYAAQGKLHQGLLEALLADPYFSRPAPKSSGREYFHLAWLCSQLDSFGLLAPADVQRTLLELTAQSIADALRGQGVCQAYLCGGGVHNKFLQQRLRALLPDVALATTDVLGAHPDWMEAMAFAWLAWAHCHQQPSNLPSVTGAQRAAVLGSYYPVA